MVRPKKERSACEIIPCSLFKLCTVTYGPRLAYNRPVHCGCESPSEVDSKTVIFQWTHCLRPDMINKIVFQYVLSVWKLLAHVTFVDASLTLFVLESNQNSLQALHQPPDTLTGSQIAWHTESNCRGLIFQRKQTPWQLSQVSEITSRAAVSLIYEDALAAKIQDLTWKIDRR